MNATQNRNYIGHISRHIESTFNEILKTDSASLFRKSSRVQLSSQFSESNPNLQLVFCGKTISDRETGTFTQQKGDISVVYRNPVEITLNYVLQCSQLSIEHRFSYEERLLSFFFDNKAIAPTIPDNYKEIPELYKRLSKKAEIRLLPEKEIPGLFQMKFEYLALYHSGNPLREERRVETRVIHYNQQTKGAHDGRRI